MKTLIKNKGLLLVIAIFIMAILIYNSFFKPEASSISTEASAMSIGDDLLKIHNELQLVTLDKDIFSSTSYLKLVDFSIAIPAQSLGRPNPFDLIGRD